MLQRFGGWWKAGIQQGQSGLDEAGLVSKKVRKNSKVSRIRENSRWKAGLWQVGWKLEWSFREEKSIVYALVLSIGQCGSEKPTEKTEGRT